MTTVGTKGSWTIRAGVAADCVAVLPLMRGLAEFEHYADAFAVTEDVLRRQGFETVPPDFQLLVAERDDGAIIGVLVYYFVPFTFRAKPTLYTKELFVRDDSRGRGIGEALMRTVAGIAGARGCAQVRWQVAHWNAGGVRFYERLGARPDPTWVDYALDATAIAALASVDG